MFRRRALPATLVLAATITLAACGGDDDASQEASAGATLPTTTSAAPETAEPTGPARSDRGNLIKQLGEEGGYGNPEDPDGPNVFTFAVDAIRVDQPCDSGFADAPDNGHFIGIDIRAATTADFSSDWFIQFTADHFEVIGPDGLTITNVSGRGYSCMDDSSAFTLDTLGPAQQYAGTVVIDSPVTSGTLVYKAPGEPDGWEWQF